jgi:hypothetical protein
MSWENIEIVRRLYDRLGVSANLDVVRPICAARARGASARAARRM